MSGPGSATDTAVVVWNGASGTLVRNSGVLIDGSDNLFVPGNITTNGTVDGRDVAADGSSLDSHLANLLNPHAVTAAQVGAPTTAQFTGHTGNEANPHNVTYDQTGAAALAGDAAQLFSVADPTAGAHAASRQWVESVLPVIVFGTEPQDAVSDAPSSTTAVTWQDKTTLNTSSLPAGTYRVGFVAQVRNDNKNNGVDCRLYNITTATEYDLHEITASQDADNWYSVTSFIYVTLTGVNDIRIQWQRNGTLGTAYIKNARIELWRIT